VELVEYGATHSRSGTLRHDDAVILQPVGQLAGNDSFGIVRIKRFVELAGKVGLKCFNRAVLQEEHRLTRFRSVVIYALQKHFRFSECIELPQRTLCLAALGPLSV